MNTRTLLYLFIVIFAVLLVSNARFLTGEEAAAPEPIAPQGAPSQ